jgi:hypothetical protein
MRVIEWYIGNELFKGKAPNLWIQRITSTMTTKKAKSRRAWKKGGVGVREA